MADSHAHTREIVGAHLGPAPARPPAEEVDHDAALELGTGQTTDPFQPDATAGSGETSAFGLTHIVAIFIGLATLGVMAFLALQGEHSVAMT